MQARAIGWALIATLLLVAGDASAICPDGIVQSPEDCDDGNTTSGDGCFSTCHLEDDLLLSGVAQGSTGMGGNAVKVWVFGFPVQTHPTAGQDAATVAASLAAEVNASSTLSGFGVSAVAVGNRLVTNGTLTGVQIKDAGIFQCAPAVPALSGWGLVSLALAAIVTGMAWRRFGVPR